MEYGNMWYIIIGFIIVTVILKYFPNLEKNYWGFRRPKVRPNWKKLGVDKNGQIYLKK